MNDFVGMDWEVFFYTLSSLIYAMLHVLIVLTGIGLIIHSVDVGLRTDHISLLGIIFGIVIILFGIIWGVTR